MRNVSYEAGNLLVEKLIDVFQNQTCGGVCVVFYDHAAF